MNPSHDENFFKTVSRPELMADLFSTLNSNCDFYLCLASTATSDVEGISAAGLSPSSRRLTPAADAEALVLGYPLSLDKLPVSPKGVVSPVVITRACLSLAKVIPQIVNCGSFVSPKIACIDVNSEPSSCISTGSAMSPNLVSHLFDAGLKYGRNNSQRDRTMVISECVPGGTTTALGVLSALKYSVRNSLSSSIPNCNHDARWKIVESGIVKSGLSSDASPFDILAALGDPMQPFVAGMTLAASETTSVVLAGGSQMLAVYALCKALAPQYSQRWDDAKIGIVTTKWVAFDASASLSAVTEEIGAPLAASCPDFRNSRHAGLQSYEFGNVKEGVGAGAALCLGYNAVQKRESELMQAIDQCYDEMVGHSLAVAGDRDL